MKKLTMMLAGLMIFAVAGTVVASDSHDAKGKQHVSHRKTAPKAPAALSLYDANDQYIGAFLDEDVAVTQFASGYKILPFQNDGRIWGGVILFSTPDCSGTPFIETGYGMSYQRVIRVDDFLFAGKSGVPVTIEPYSAKSSDVEGCSYLGGNYELKVMEAEEMTESLPFNYPVAYPLTIK